MTRTILILILLISIASGLIFWLQRKTPIESLSFSPTPKSSFGERAEYVNKQANFSFTYPNTWKLEIKDTGDDSIHGVRIKGRSGYIDFLWGIEHEKGGCSTSVSELSLKEETIEVCNFVQDNKSEVWNQIVKEEGIKFFGLVPTLHPPQRRHEMLFLMSFRRSISFNNPLDKVSKFCVT